MKGKDICNILKAIRIDIAEKYKLQYNPTECTHKGDCAGTCPHCDEEVRDLQRQLDEKGITNIQLNEMISSQLGHFQQEDNDESDETMCLQGDVTSDHIINLDGMPSMPPTEKMVMGKPAGPLYTKKKVFFKECPIAGWKFHEPDEWWDDAEEGDSLVLIREPKNKHDRHAIAVAVVRDYDYYLREHDPLQIIGYVPRTENEMIAKMMDMGWKDAFTAELTTIKDHGSPDSRLRMTLYIQSKDEFEDMEEDALFAMKMNEEDFEGIKDQLFEKGFVHFRWGGFPPWEHELPETGHQVILFYQDVEKTQLYRMKVIATSDDAAYFLENPEEELDIVDDCYPFILTNIHGPISIENDELSFMDEEEFSIHQPNGKLSWELKEKFEELFEQYN